MELDDFFSTEYVYEAKVLIDPDRIVIENTQHGNRRIINIIGGSFKGPKIEGIVLPGGADWQILRSDGVNELDARYTMRTNDGVPIHVRNRVLSRPDPESQDPFSPGYYRRSVLSFEAPADGAYAWLNKNVFLGTLTPATTEKEAAVIIRAWKLL